MEQEIKELYNFLAKELVDMNSRWIISKQLYTSKDTVALLNQTAPSAFSLFFWSLYDSIILGISRLTDKPEGADKNHFTLLKLAQLMGNDRIKREIAACKADLRPIRERRNRQKGHNDRRAPTIPVAARKEIDTALSALTRVMHSFEKELGLSPMAYDIPILPGDGTVLLSILKKYSDTTERIRRGHMLGSTTYYNNHSTHLDEAVAEVHKVPVRAVAERHLLATDPVLQVLCQVYGLTQDEILTRQ